MASDVPLSQSDNNAQPTAKPIEDRAPADLHELALVMQNSREKLKCLVRLRLDPRVRARLDESDVLQDVFLEATRRFPEYHRSRPVPLFVWLRSMASQRVVDLHRRHLGTQSRNAALDYVDSPHVSSHLLTQRIVDQLTTVSHVVIQSETAAQVQAALDLMDPIDREVIALRNFEMLSNEEVAQVLQIKKAASSNRYIRALNRLRTILLAAGLNEGDLLHG